MKIVIIGDGKVGYALAEQLTQEDQNHEVTLVDNNAAALRKAVEKLDVLCVQGSGSSISVLREAGADHADLCIAVTSSDELNMVCSLLAEKLGAGRVIARIRNPEYAQSEEFLKEAIGIDHSINPELRTAAEIARLLRYPHARSVESFAKGRIEMIEYEMTADSPILGKTLAHLRPQLPMRVLFSAVQRGADAFIPNGSTVFYEGDNIFVVGEPHQLLLFEKHLGHSRSKNRIRDVMIVGGSRIGFYLTRMLLASKMRCCLIEINTARCEELSQNLRDALIIQGDGSDHELLEQERILSMDAFIALTDRDEDNLISCMYARDLGISRVVAKVTRASYERLARGVSLISPKDIAASEIVRYVRAMANSEGSFVERLHRILRGDVDIMEFTVHETARLTNIPLKNLSLKSGILVAALMHQGKIIIPFGSDMIREGDTVVIVTGSGQSFVDINDILDT